MQRKLVVTFLVGLILTFSSCYKGKNVDLVIHNARIHSLNETNATFEAMAIKDGKIVEVGPERQILNKYSSEEEIDAGGRDIYPGLTDAHCELFEAAKKKLSLDLTGTRSVEELLVRLEKYGQTTKKEFIVARGLDTTLWEHGFNNSNKLIISEKINKSFPKIPVCIYLTGEETVFVNKAILNKIGEKESFKTNGFISDKKTQTTINKLFKFSKSLIKEKVIEIQNQLFQYGITGIHAIGIEQEDRQILAELVKSNQLMLNIYGMLNPSEENIEFAKKNGIQHFQHLTFRSFYISNSLSVEALNRLSIICESTNYQLAVLSSEMVENQSMEELIASVNEGNKDHRWRIENAQWLEPKKYKKLSELGIFPIINPNKTKTEKRNFFLKSILQPTGMVAMGFNFPFENFNPFLTIHSAVQENSPNERLSLDESFKAMTTWATFASFQEDKLGTIEKGKQATFSVFEFPIVSTPKFKQNYAFMTFIDGEKVYSSE